MLASASADRAHFEHSSLFPTDTRPKCELSALFSTMRVNLSSSAYADTKDDNQYSIKRSRVRSKRDGDAQIKRTRNPGPRTRDPTSSQKACLCGIGAPRRGYKPPRAALPPVIAQPLRFTRSYKNCPTPPPTNSRPSAPRPHVSSHAVSVHPPRSERAPPLPCSRSHTAAQLSGVQWASTKEKSSTTQAQSCTWANRTRHVL